MVSNSVFVLNDNSVNYINKLLLVYTQKGGEKNMVQIAWKNVLNGVDSALEFFRGQGVKPTLRTLFYNLYSKALIPNTKTAYQSLSKQLVKARKEGRYAWDFLEDKTRVVLGSIEDMRFNDDVAEDFEKRLVEKLEELDLESILSDVFDYLKPWLNVGYWADQKVVVELWIEKEALASTMQTWTYSKYLPIRVNRGYSSWTFIYNNVQALKFSLDKHEKVVVLYLGDLDPSGVDIQRFLTESIEYLGVDPSKVELVRLGVTHDQVEKYKLPPTPEDAETLAKLERDPRKKTYAEQYVVELDALIAYVPSEFRRELLETIERFRDRDVYDKLQAKKKELEEKCNELLEEIKEKAREKIREGLD